MKSISRDWRLSEGRVGRDCTRCDGQMKEIGRCS
jgi:hypothetical protein